MFELQSDDSIRIIEHVGRVPISMEEAKKRMEMFHNLFLKELIQRGSVPPLMDKERGGVAALSEYYAAAEDEGYTIHYGFTGSFQPSKPLLPTFMIALRHNMSAIPLPIRRKIVEPPQGYEWYSLDPKVNTPDPGRIPIMAPESKIKFSEKEIPELPKVKANDESTVKPEILGSKSRIIWLLGLFGLLLVIATAVIRRHGMNREQR